jgi:predicted 2-oxoglutarate/Fe(II)-dependent dioxygenase YbiX
MWYQQYIQNDTHTWHIHGENYTGVYYLELPKDSPKTELIDQLDLNKKISIEAIEGDVIIFPSFIIHRSPKITNNLKKTIISFNLNFTKVKESIFSKLNDL